MSRSSGTITRSCSLPVKDLSKLLISSCNSPTLETISSWCCNFNSFSITASGALSTKALSTLATRGGIALFTRSQGLHAYRSQVSPIIAINSSLKSAIGEIILEIGFNFETCISPARRLTTYPRTSDLPNGTLTKTPGTTNPDIFSGIT